jgi:hypothetical protein
VDNCGDCCFLVADSKASFTGFVPRAVHVGFVMGEVALGQVFL